MKIIELLKKKLKKDEQYENITQNLACLNGNELNSGETILVKGKLEETYNFTLDYSKK